MSYLIVGAGVFGVSTAYHIIRKYPNASVTLVDRDAFDAESRVAASWDWNKVVRADYDDFVYCQLALEAQEIFKNDALWQPYFKQTGVYWICRSDYAQNVIDHHHKLGRKDDIVAMPVAKAKKLYGGLFENADYDGAKEVLINKASGYALAGDALRAVTREVMRLGVKYVVGEVSSLQINNGGSCKGIRTTSGRVLEADHVILCTGAYTPKLLELSAAKSGRTSLRAEGRILAAGITTGMAQLDEKQYAEYANMPVGFQGYTVQHGKPFIGTLPPTKDRELKWWGSKIFSNTYEVVPGRRISAPPATPDYSQWKVPQRLKEDIVEQKDLWYGSRGQDWPMTKHRICWDAFTTTSDFIISPHAAAKGLYVATCGSFHGFKFFPVIGKYVLQMLEGSLAPELEARWAWDRERPDAVTAGNVEYPNAEMNDLLGPEEEEQVPGGEASLLELCPAESIVLIPGCKSGQDERLQTLEDKLDLLLSGGGLPNQQRPHPSQSIDEANSISDRAFSTTPPARGPGRTTANPFVPQVTNLKPSSADMSTGINLYFKYCHRQPIWCFERDEMGSYDSLPEELACSILALTSRFVDKRDHLQLYGNNAKTLIMLRIANGTVDLTTIESLCLLSYSSFIDGNVHLGQFHLGLSFQLCRSAMLDTKSVYVLDDPAKERKKRLFWSLQLLEQFYGRQDGLLSVPTDIWRPAYSSAGGLEMELDSKAPPLPRDDLGTSDPSEPGIWNTSVHLGWVWSQVRKYVFDCSHNIWKEPWRHDSMYAKVHSDFMETENRIPMCHRYDSVKFYERTRRELKMNRDYWATWLKEQFTYHAIPTVLNHPFLYIIGAQHNPNLGIPNTFWRRSSEQALLHATWIARMIDMVMDKQVELADPFFGHVAATAATVHLYYCCAAAVKLKHKSNADFAKCRRFLKGFIPHSPACEALDRNLDALARIAAGSDGIDVADWMPCKIYLSVPLMWGILQFNCMNETQEIATASLMNSSLTPSGSPETVDEASTLEIIVATAPEISINTADGGQESPTLSFKGPLHPAGGSSRDNDFNPDTPTMEQIDNLTFNTTPWLYADSAQLVYTGGAGPFTSDQGNAWWEGGNMNTLRFNHF
ncbi:hypothetical protein S7711_03592 [Stachybotrys chartarum IBT 7711]|uniref:Transcription factor domain-containing protein n=1 Tax=Stachybotrys chartarum (strain CBS 109288 / IBT 7711) TaxID=1280523 RepID=A0A084AGU6_STACB|nr:hypothetical protein S7711_03592 [Stachybotrys chartarum IBT 7711]